MNTRQLARRIVPAEARLRFAVLRRAVRDRRSGVKFARERARAECFPFKWAEYSRSFIDYPGQEELSKAKRQNQRVLASLLDGVVIQPGEVFSVWELAGRPTSSLGYAPAAALKDGELVRETGGAICLLSTVLYNTGLLAGLAGVERKCHSVDSYGDSRYFELGRDAAIEFGYVDLRFANPHTERLRLGITVTEAEVIAELSAAQTKPFDVDLVVSPAEPGPLDRYTRRTFEVRTTRTITQGGAIRMSEELGPSRYSVVGGDGSA